MRAPWRAGRFPGLLVGVPVSSSDPDITMDSKDWSGTTREAFLEDSHSGGFLVRHEGWAWRPAFRTKPLSVDIRDRAMARLDAGKTVREVADALSVAPSSVVKWSQRLRATGSAAPGKIGGHVPRKIRGGQADRLRARMANAPVTPARPGGRTGGTRAAGRLSHDVGFRPCRGSQLQKNRAG